MKDKTGLQFLTVFGVLLVFVGIVGSVLYIFNTQKKVIEQQQAEPTNNVTQVSDATKQFTANNQDWSIEYPADWYVKSDDNFDYVQLAAEAISDEQTEPNVIYISKLRQGKLSDLIDESLNVLSGAEVTSLHNGEIVGTQIEGVIAEGAVHKFAPGTFSIDTYFVMPDASIVHIRTNNKNYLNTYQSVVDSFSALQSPNTADIVEANIEVYDPQAGDTISSPFTIVGRARTFENTVNYVLLDDDGEVIIEGFTTSDAPDIGEFGDFTADISFITTSRSGTLQVFQYSAKDGSKDDLVEIEVQF